MKIKKALTRFREKIPSKDTISETGKKALLTGNLDLPDNKCTFSLRLTKQVILFIYFAINLIYPVITVAMDEENYAYNIICSAISFLALLSQFADIPDMLRSLKRLYHCCRSCSYDEDEEAELCDCCEGDNCKKYTERYSGVTNFIADNLVFPSVICGLLGFINGRTWELDDGLDYFDFGLFALGIFSDLILVKGKEFWKYLLFRYVFKKTIENKGKDFRNCCCCDPFNITLVYLILRELMHIAMFGMVSCKLYADTFSGEDDPEEGNYRIEGFTWYAIVATWYMPTVSFFYFISINVYLYYRVLYLYKAEDDESDVNVSTDLLLCSCIRNPVAIVLIYIILPSYIAFNIGAATQNEGIPNVLTVTWGLFQWIFNISFIMAHIQALLFHVLLCQFPCVYCILCCCSNTGLSTNDAAIKVV